VTLEATLSLAQTKLLTKQLRKLEQTHNKDSIKTISQPSLPKNHTLNQDQESFSLDSQSASIAQ
jgi:hypothetical protein